MSRSNSPLSSLGARLPRLGARHGGDADNRDKGPKSQDAFEVWHHHAALRRPSEWALLLQFDQRR